VRFPENKISFSPALLENEGQGLFQHPRTVATMNDEEVRPAVAEEGRGDETRVPKASAEEEDGAPPPRAPPTASKTPEQEESSSGGSRRHGKKQFAVTKLAEGSNEAFQKMVLNPVREIEEDLLGSTEKLPRHNKASGSAGKEEGMDGVEMSSEHNDQPSETPMSSSPKNVVGSVKIIKESEQVVEKVVTAPLKEGVDVATRMMKKKRSSTTSQEGLGAGSGDADDTDLIPALGPDETLQKMTIIIRRTLLGVSVQKWHDKCWSEREEPFYGPWLRESGKSEVNVGNWEEGDGITGDWDQETYQRRRTVTFQFERTGLNGGTTHVRHTQYCRLDRDSRDRCILAMKVEMQGIPFADAFTVEIRWVATRAGSDSLQLQVGLFVNFSKHVVVADKIRSGTTSNTTQAQLELFEKMKSVCGGAEKVVVEPITREKVETRPSIAVDAKSVTAVLVLCIVFHVLFGPWIDRIGKAIDWRSIFANLLFAVAFHFAFGKWLDQVCKAVFPLTKEGKESGVDSSS
jgi:hypothetical protein